MPELRKDPVIGRWVIIASERARRPGNFIDTSDNETEHENGECSFCQNEREVIPADLPSSDISVVYSKPFKSEISSICNTMSGLRGECFVPQ